MLLKCSDILVPSRSYSQMISFLTPLDIEYFSESLVYFPECSVLKMVPISSPPIVAFMNSNWVIVPFNCVDNVGKLDTEWSGPVRPLSAT